MKTVNEIQEILAQHKKELREKHKVSEVGIFGSYVRGEQKRGSDIDLVAEFEAFQEFDLIDTQEEEWNGGG
jgi:hypothetical protein